MYLNSKNEQHKQISLVAAIISLLIMGTSVIPTQAIVQAQRDTQGEKQSIKEETTAQSASQKVGQDNVCVRRDEDCEEANQGQQIAGKDNEATGFNHQSANVQANQIRAVTQPVTPPVTPPVGTCISCFTTAFTSVGITNQQ
jgi:hypothetical protein